MKRSNIILISLIALLIIIPLISFGTFSLIPNDTSITGFLNNVKVIVIKNSILTPKDIHVKDKVSISKIYYEGSKQYIPEIHSKKDTLFIGSTKEYTKEKSLNLYIHLLGVNKIILNNKPLNNKDFI